MSSSRNAALLKIRKMHDVGFIPASPTKLRTGDWGARIQLGQGVDEKDLYLGAAVTVKTKAGKSWHGYISSTDIKSFPNKYGPGQVAITKYESFNPRGEGSLQNVSELIQNFDEHYGWSDGDLAKFVGLPEATVRVLKHGMGLELRPDEISKVEMEKYGIDIHSPQKKKSKKDLDKYMKERKTKMGKGRKLPKEKSITQANLDKVLQH